MTEPTAEPAALPKLSKNFTDIFGEAPTDVISAYDVDSLPQLDPTRRQLVSWLTLPLAAQAVEDLVWVPMATRAEQEGVTVTPYAKLRSSLEDNIVETRVKTMTGNIMPAYFHILYEPADDNSVRLIIPNANDRSRHTVGVYRLNMWANKKPASVDEVRKPEVQDTTTAHRANDRFRHTEVRHRLTLWYGKRTAPPVDEIRGTISSYKIDRELTKRTKNISLFIPGDPRAYPRAAACDDLPIKSASVTATRRVRGNGTGGRSI